MGSFCQIPGNLMSGYPKARFWGPSFLAYIRCHQICLNKNVLSGFYADDSQVYLICKVCDFLDCHQQIESCVAELQAWMSSNRLKLYGDKIELTVYASPRISKQLPVALPLVVGEDRIVPQTSCKNLGSFFDQHMSMDIHINNTCKNSYYHLSKIASIRSLIDRDTSEALIHDFVSSRLDYCNSLLFGITKQNIYKLQKLQNKAARICLQVSRKQRIPSLSLLKELHWLPISYRIEFKIRLLTYKCLNNLAPQYLSDLLQVRDCPRQTRSSQLDLLVIP